MEEREIFANLVTVPPVFVRLDGRCVPCPQQRNSRLPGLLTTGSSGGNGAGLAAACGGERLSPVFAYNVPRTRSACTSASSRSQEGWKKIDSVAASYAASALTLALGVDEAARVLMPGSFRSRHRTLRVEYMVGRQTRRGETTSFLLPAVRSFGGDEHGRSGRKASAGLPRRISTR